jgi:hypothetical protein
MRRLVLVTARALLVAAFAATVWYGLYPGQEHPSVLPWDKAEHFLAFAALTVTLAMAFPRIPMPWLVGGLILACGVLEAAQALPIVARDAELSDWLTGVLAVVCVAAPLALLRVRERLLDPERPDGAAKLRSKEA